MSKGKSRDLRFVPGLGNLKKIDASFSNSRIHCCVHLVSPHTPTDGAARIFSSNSYALTGNQTHVSRVSLSQRTFFRTLYQLSYRGCGMSDFFYTYCLCSSSRGSSRVSPLKSQLKKAHANKKVFDKLENETPPV